MPNFRAPEFLLPALAQIYRPEKGKEDLEVLSRKFHLALSELTELIKKKSELRENHKIARDRLEKLRASLSTARADKKIFEEDNPPPKPRKILFWRIKTKREKNYEAKISKFDERIAQASKKVEEAEEERNKLTKELDEIITSYEKKQGQADELRKALVNAGILAMISALPNEEDYNRAFLDARAVARGDRRLFTARILVEALIINPHHGFATFGEVKELFLPETTAEYRLVENFLHYLNGRELGIKELGAFLPSHFLFEENYALYRLLRAINGFADEEEEEHFADFTLLLKIISEWKHDRIWLSSEELGQLKKIRPEDDPLLAELLLFAVLQVAPEKALELVGIDTTLWASTPLSTNLLEKVRLSFIQFSSLRQAVPKAFSESVERFFALTLIAIKESAPEQVFQIANELLRPQISGELNSFFVQKCHLGKPPLTQRKNPKELYWLPGLTKV